MNTVAPPCTSLTLSPTLTRAIPFCRKRISSEVGWRCASILPPTGRSSVPNTKCVELPFCGSTSRIKREGRPCTPSRGLHTRRSPSFFSRINGVGFCDCFCGSNGVTAEPQINNVQSPMIRGAYRIRPPATQSTAQAQRRASQPDRLLLYSGDGFQFCREVPQERRSVHELHAANLVAFFPDFQNHLDYIIDMTLCVNAARNRQPHQVHACGLVEHQGPDLD